MANGVTDRGSLVSSARSAAPSQPMKQYRGSNAASTKPYQRAPPDVRWVDTRMWKPASWWKDRKSTRLNSSHMSISYAVFCLKKKKKDKNVWSHITEDERSEKS